MSASTLPEKTRAR